MMNIDLHNHWLPQAYIDAARSGEVESVVGFDGKCLLFPRSDPSLPKIRMPLLPAFNDWDVRLSDMEKMELGMTAISFLPFTFHYRGDATLVAGLHRLMNDAMAETIQQYPDSLKALGNVPLQDVGLATEELRRIMKMGFAGVQVGSNVCGAYLGEPAFFEFWEAAAELGALVLIHPTDVAADERMPDFHMRNIIGNPLDTTICVGSLIFNEVVEKLPDLKILLCHAGGMVPFLIGRWDHGYRVRSECKHLKKPPSAYLGSFYYDVIAFSKKALAFTVDVVGADRVYLGTDYPLDMGLTAPLQVIRELELKPEDERKICYGNAARLLGL